MVYRHSSKALVYRLQFISCPNVGANSHAKLQEHKISSLVWNTGMDILDWSHLIFQGHREGHTWAKAGSTPGEGPYVSIFVGLVACSRVPGQYSKGGLAPSPTTRTPSMSWQHWESNRQP